MAVGLIGCNTYSTARQKKTKLKTDSLVSTLLQRAADDKSQTPEQRIGRMLNAAHLSSIKLKANPANQEALQEYNFAVSRIFEIVFDNKMQPWVKPIKCPGYNGDWIFSLKTDKEPSHNPSYFRVLPADRFEFKGKLVQNRTTKAGLGAPMIASSHPEMDFTKFDPFIMGRNVYYGMTIVVDFQGQNCVAAYYDPLSTENVQAFGRSYPLAADYTAPIALALAELKPRKSELQRMFKADEFKGTARLARLQPYDPKKIPILCIHGLGDSQATWAPMIETLRGDAEIRKHYQFWFFSFPTGFPYPIMADKLRADMDKMSAANPGHKKWVVIGHSTGGMIARELITDSGMKIWDAYLPAPPDKIPLPPEAKKVIEGALIFEHRPDVGRVIFASASLGGSDKAVGFFADLGRKLVGNSNTLLGDADTTMKAISLVKHADAGRQMEAMPNGIDVLNPDNRFLKTINAIPPVPSIPYHSIMGNKGKKGPIEKSHDGLVPYWSSHIDGAQSEVIVNSGHWTNQNPEAIAEVRRILLQHVGIRATAAETPAQ